MTTDEQQIIDALADYIGGEGGPLPSVAELAARMAELDPEVTAAPVSWLRARLDGLSKRDLIDVRLIGGRHVIALTEDGQLAATLPRDALCDCGTSSDAHKVGCPVLNRQAKQLRANLQQAGESMARAGQSMAQDLVAAGPQLGGRGRPSRSASPMADNADRATDLLEQRMEHVMQSWPNRVEIKGVVATECEDCGKPLTPSERKRYGSQCEGCAQDKREAMDDEREGRPTDPNRLDVQVIRHNTPSRGGRTTQALELYREAQRDGMVPVYLAPTTDMARDATRRHGVHAFGGWQFATAANSTRVTHAIIDDVHLWPRSEGDPVELVRKRMAEGGVIHVFGDQQVDGDLDASPEGEGMPPVGAECLFALASDEGDDGAEWVDAKVVGYDGPAAVVAIDGHGYAGSRHAEDFRPARPASLRAEDRAVEAIDNVWCQAAQEAECGMRAVYRAIRDGRIPGVTLEGAP